MCTFMHLIMHFWNHIDLENKLLIIIEQYLYCHTKISIIKEHRNIISFSTIKKIPSITYVLHYKRKIQMLVQKKYVWMSN